MVSKYFRSARSRLGSCPSAAWQSTGQEPSQFSKAVTGIGVFVGWYGSTLDVGIGGLIGTIGLWVYGCWVCLVTN